MRHSGAQHHMLFYVKRIFGLVLLLSLAAVFLFSGISKLYSFEQLLWNIMDVGISNMLIAGIVARLFVGFELLLGGFLLCHLYLKRFTYPAVIALLIFFSVYLMFLISTQGDGGNCGCFGEAYAMKPSAGIVKNIILLGVTAVLWLIYPLAPYKGSAWITGIIGTAALIIPFLFFPLRASRTPKVVERPIDLNALYAEQPQPSVDLRKGKHVVAFMSLSCPHCKKAAFLFHVIRKQHPELPLFMIITGSDPYEKAFFEESRSEDVPHFRFRNTEVFMRYAPEGVPAIYYINNSVIERDANYFQVDPENIKEWLK